MRETTVVKDKTLKTTLYKANILLGRYADFLLACDAKSNEEIICVLQMRDNIDLLYKQYTATAG
ncbi:hypothetical protein [Spartinivicinus ruber]|uniref:hypothetical protein n=1 Tax=Spartinivicinus ruber TaxID=2683272 RepID=UPI0013D426A0|nr:hypothetical protein [Spartinivicinus ruber]